MSEIKLLPCPFCGGEAKLNERYREGVANRKMYWVSCRKCGVKQPYHSLAGYRKVVGAIKAWNTRKPVERILERLEEEKGILFDENGKVLTQEDYFIDIDEAIEIIKEEVN
jgi:Lar family restriction alleviation protein